jgi:hypothetical protein
MRHGGFRPDFTAAAFMHNEKLDQETVICQIRCLPETRDGRKIPFELINENPLPKLPDLMREVHLSGIELSQINLTLRADWLITGAHHLKEALRMAGEQGIYVLLSSIGFESFDDTILNNLNKGLSVKKNLEAIRLIRQLKEDFPHQLGQAGKAPITASSTPQPGILKKVPPKFKKHFSLRPAKRYPAPAQHAPDYPSCIRFG